MSGGATALPAGGVALALVAALFALGALVIALAGRRARPAAASELWQAYLGTTVIAAAVLVPAAIHPMLFTAVAAIAAYRCAVELAAIERYRLNFPASLAIAAAVGGGAWLGAGQDARASSLVMVSTAAIIVLTAPLYTRAAMRPPPQSLAWALAAALPAVAAAQLAHLVHRPDGFLWLFFLYATVEVQDSTAFLVGRMFGRRALLPRLSPRKTIEGAAAGAAFGIAVGAAIAVFLLERPAGVALALAGLVAASGFAGDVFTSGLKRAAGVKDFPPVSVLHGGVMDIYDSTLFAALALGLCLWAAPI